MEAGSGWQHDRRMLLTSAEELCGSGGRTAIRTADLLLARALAGQLGLLGRDVSAAKLRDELATVALFPPPRVSTGRAVRADAIASADACALHMEGGSFFDAWSESSQDADPGRKGRGAFSTPAALGRVMAGAALDRPLGDGVPNALDPSAGHGALLLALLRELIASGVPPKAAVDSLHGVELDPHARELCCLVLWLEVANPGITLEEISTRIVVGNALTARWAVEPFQGAIIDSPAQKQRPFVWEQTFPGPFGRGGFDLVLANPPWESLRGLHPAGAEDWAEREATRERLGAQAATGRELPPLFSAQGGGDRNLYKAFVELFPHLLATEGSLVALLPGAFSSDFGMQHARQYYLDHLAMERWTGFENLVGYFPIDGRYKFGLLRARRDARGTARVRVRFMAREAAEAADDRGHLSLSRSQIEELGGSTRMLPEVSSSRELSILERAFRHGTAFFDSEVFGPIEYRRELDLTLDRKAGRFVHVTEAQARQYAPNADGTWSNGSDRLVPLIEGRMVSAWDFYEKSWESGRGRTARWSANDLPLQGCQPQFLAEPLPIGESRIAICDVTSATNTRTMRATWVPAWPCGNTAPVLVASGATQCLSLLAVVNSMTFDWLLRRVAAGLHLNRFYLATMRLPSVGDGELKELARFAATKTWAGRSSELDASELDGLKRLGSARGEVPAARVEAIVAKGYGLDAADMRHILDGTTADRKGLWRYYAAVPEAEQVAAESVRMLEAA
jgi:hypothetical protein